MKKIKILSTHVIPERFISEADNEFTKQQEKIEIEDNQNEVVYNDGNHCEKCGHSRTKKKLTMIDNQQVCRTCRNEFFTVCCEESTPRYLCEICSQCKSWFCSECVYIPKELPYDFNSLYCCEVCIFDEKIPAEFGCFRILGKKRAKKIFCSRPLKDNELNDLDKCVDAFFEGVCGERAETAKQEYIQYAKNKA